MLLYQFLKFTYQSKGFTRMIVQKIFIDLLFQCAQVQSAGAAPGVCLPNRLVSSLCKMPPNQTSI
jgi:hypothetical protein